jgi:hypothetical protein
MHVSSFISLPVSGRGELAGGSIVMSWTISSGLRLAPSVARRIRECGDMIQYEFANHVFLRADQTGVGDGNGLAPFKTAFASRKYS